MSDNTYYEEITAPIRRVPLTENGDTVNDTWYKFFSKIKSIVAVLRPKRSSQSAQPTPISGELRVWRDTDDDKTYLVYTDPDVGARKVEMT